MICRSSFLGESRFRQLASVLLSIRIDTQMHVDSCVGQYPHSSSFTLRIR